MVNRCLLSLTILCLLSRCDTPPGCGQGGEVSTLLDFDEKDTKYFTAKAGIFDQKWISTWDGASDEDCADRGYKESSEPLIGDKMEVLLCSPADFQSGDKPKIQQLQHDSSTFLEYGSIVISRASRSEYADFILRRILKNNHENAEAIHEYDVDQVDFANGLILIRLNLGTSLEKDLTCGDFLEKLEEP